MSVAEDNQTNQLAAVRMLEMLGYASSVVVNGFEAVTACRAGGFAVVLMDNQMPGMDGLAATREIRALERAIGSARVPIIAVTANAMQGDREKCLLAGMDDYIAKPFKVAQLRAVLERWCRAAAAPDAPPVRAIDSAIFDEFRNAGAKGAANAFVVALIDQYLAESVSLLAAVDDALMQGCLGVGTRRTQSEGFIGHRRREGARHDLRRT